MFEIKDAKGWTGVEAEDLASARRACEVIATEGYDAPFEIYSPGGRFPIVTLTGFDEAGGPIWKSSDAARRWAA